MYGMAGIRLGYGLCRDDELICRMHQCGQAWPVSTAATDAGMAALKLTEHTGQVKDYVANEREYLFEALSRLNIHFLKSQVNYILFRISTALADVAKYSSCSISGNDNGCSWLHAIAFLFCCVGKNITDIV